MGATNECYQPTEAFPVAGADRDVPGGAQGGTQQCSELSPPAVPPRFPPSYFSTSVVLGSWWVDLTFTHHLLQRCTLSHQLLPPSAVLSLAYTPINFI